MIPQCDSSILEANPRLKTLHQQLTTSILNPDGTTRTVNEDRERKEAQRELRELEIREAKKRILKRVVGQLAYAGDGTPSSGGGLPDELRDLVLIIALYLDHQGGNGGSEDDNDDETFPLLASEVDVFLSYIPALTLAISKILASDLGHLKALASTNSISSPVTREKHESTSQRGPYFRYGWRSGSTSAAHKTIPSLSTHLSNRLDVLRDTQLTTLPAAQRQVSDTAAEVLATHTKIMERAIHILERTKHGSLARAEKAHAENLAKEAEGLDAKTRIMRREIVSAMYSPETTAALVRYRGHLHDTRFRLEERQHNALRELAAYDAADDESGEGSGAMLEISRSYGALVEEVEALREEIERLGG